MAKVHNIAYLIRARIMQQITETYYEKGCQRSSLWVVWVRHVFPVVGVNYDTFLDGLPVDVSGLDERIRRRQALEWEKHRSKLASVRSLRAQIRKKKKANQYPRKIYEKIKMEK